MSRIFFATVGCISTCFVACASHDAIEADLGEVTVAVTTAPSDVKCLVIQATGGSRTVTRQISVTPGQVITAAVNGLPTGSVSIGASAYSTACSAVTSSSIPNWVSDPVTQTINLNKGTSVPLNLVLRPNGSVVPGIDWQDDATGGSSGTGGTTSTGGGTATSSCTTGVATGDACNPAVDTSVCDQSTSPTAPRTCACGSATSVWTCSPVGTTTACNDTATYSGSLSTQYGYSFVPVTNSTKSYVMTANWWNTFNGQMESINGLSFTITNQSGTAGSNPLGFPSLYIGNYAGHDASPGTNLPKLVSSITSVPVVYQSNALTMDNSNFDASIEAWFTASGSALSSTASNPGAGGAFLRVWMYKPSARQPVGTLVATATIAGSTWNVWYGTSGQPSVTYVSATPQSGMTGDLKNFISHAVTSQYGITNSQYLSVIFGGFEVWSGGTNLSLTKFCAQVN